MSNLTIVDLHQEKELSSSDKAKVAGGSVNDIFSSTIDALSGSGSGGGNGGIAGESLDDGYKNKIEVFSWLWP